MPNDQETEGQRPNDLSTPLEWFIDDELNDLEDEVNLIFRDTCSKIQRLYWPALGLARTARQKLEDDKRRDEISTIFDDYNSTLPSDMCRLNLIYRILNLTWAGFGLDLGRSSPTIFQKNVESGI